MNVIEYLYFLPAVILFCWSVIIRFRRNRLRVHRRASETLLVLAFTWFFFAAYYIPIPGMQHLFAIDMGFSVAASFFPAVYWLTIRELCGARGIRAKDRLIFIIPAIITILFAVIAVQASPEDIRQYMRSVRSETYEVASPMVTFAIVVNYVFYVVVGIFTIAVCLWAIRRKHRCVKTLKEYYVNINRESGDSISVAVAFDIINIPIILYMMFVPLGWQPQLWIQIVIFVFISVLAFLSGLYFYNIHFSISELRRQLLATMENGTIQDVIDEIREVNGETPLPEDFELMPEELFRRIREEKMFLIHGLNLMILANKLGIKRNDIAHSIHHYVGTNFSNFIRSLRIDYTVEMLEYSDAGRKLSYRELAKQSGYTDRQMFRSDFIANTGMTLQHYLGR